jgi:hypothetical protein
MQKRVTFINNATAKTGYPGVLARYGPPARRHSFPLLTPSLEQQALPVNYAGIGVPRYLVVRLYRPIFIGFLEQG